MPDDDLLIRRLIGGDATAPDEIGERVRHSTEPTLLVAAAVLADEPHELLDRAAVHASTSRDRHLVAIARARVDGRVDLLDALVRDHLADHPDDLVAAWIASLQAAELRSPTTPPRLS